MKNSKKAIAFLLCIVILLSFVACQNETPSDKETPVPTITATPQPENPAVKKYEKAISALQSEQMLKQEIEIEITRTIGTEVYTESVKRTAEFLNKGTEKMVALVTAKNILGDVVLETEEKFANGTAYFSFAEAEEQYSSAMTAEAFLARNIPAVVFDVAMYESVSFDENDDRKILFEKPIALEKWVTDREATLVSAEGELLLTANDTVDSFLYTVHYQQGPTIIQATYKVKPSVSILVPEEQELPNEEDCIAIEHIELPMLLELAYYTTSDASALVGESNTTILSEALVIAYSYGYKYNTYGTVKNDFAGKVEYEQTLTTINGTTQQAWTETYQNGKSSIIQNGGKPQETETTAKMMLDFIVEDLSTHIPTVKTSDSISMKDVGDFWLVEYDATKKLGDAYEDDTCYALFRDADYFDQYNGKYKTDKVNGYISIDKDTFCVVGINVEFQGTYTIDGEKIQLSMAINQSVNVGDPNAYEEITGELLPEEKPVDLAKPVFYEVTSPEGGKMYLLGTIHIGDEKTAYLPQEIYDAFNASDALAVEVDISDFDERIEKDKKLLEKLQKSYYYSDKTTIKDHITDELYQNALPLMKVTGYSVEMLNLMRPTTWSDFIGDLYLSSSRKLMSAKGVDMRLLQLAKKEKKEILEVEKLEDQITMDVAYSDKTMEFLLAGSLEGTRGDYLKELDTLYTLWCQGDETKIREYLKEEIPADATEEEIAAYNEYTKIMSTDRDAHMLQVAKQYLAGDKVVFYAVGLAHVLGETGLVDALRAEGYTVTLVQYQ